MLEIELKASLEGMGREAAASALAAAGFARIQTKEEVDIYYNGCGRDFRKTDEALRLRSSRVLENADGSASGEEAARTFITYKGSKVDSRSQTRTELETSVGDLETMKALLGKLGYSTVMTVRKVRVYFTKDNVTACLDEVDGLGAFLELEQIEAGADEEKKEAVIDRLLALLESLGIPKSQLLRRSYLELLMAKTSA